MKDITGQRILVIASGLDPVSPATIFLNGNPVGVFTTDANGGANTDFIFAATFKPGPNPVQAATAMKCGQTNLNVSPPRG